VPITINLPPGATGPLLGPGVGYQVVSDFIGPLPQGSYFDFRVSEDPEGVQECFGWVVFVSGVQFSGNVLADPTASVELGNQHILQDGDTGHLLVTLHSPTSTLDSGAVTVTWDETVGMGQQILLKPSGTVQGGFTAEDRANLTDVEQATTEPVQSQLNPVVTHILNGLDLLTWFPVNRLSAAECRTLTGRGSLNRDQLGLQVAAMGFRWRILVVPPSFGVRDGALQEYIERIAQFVKINADNSGELYVDEVTDVFYNLGKLSWSWNNFPHQILYDITPGCQVEFCWLLF
jgi:hypothetical protein